MKLIRKSWFGNLNYWFLQFFFIRLQKVIYDEKETVSWELIGFILPLTGWCTDYIRFLEWSIILFHDRCMGCDRKGPSLHVTIGNEDVQK